MTETVVVIHAPHFCAGLIIRDGHVIDAAPILRWTIGKERDQLKAYLHRKGWRGVLAPPPSDATPSEPSPR